MHLVCKKTLTKYNIDFLVRGGYYQVRRTYQQEKQSKIENIWVIADGIGFEQFFLGPENELNTENRVIQGGTDFEPYQLMDYFYLPGEWREIQLQQLLD